MEFNRLSLTTCMYIFILFLNQLCISLQKGQRATHTSPGTRLDSIYLFFFADMLRASMHGSVIRANERGSQLMIGNSYQIHYPNRFSFSHFLRKYKYREGFSSFPTISLVLMHLIAHSLTHQVCLPIKLRCHFFTFMYILCSHTHNYAYDHTHIIIICWCYTIIHDVTQYVRFSKDVKKFSSKKSTTIYLEDTRENRKS